MELSTQINSYVRIDRGLSCGGLFHKSHGATGRRGTVAFCYTSRGGMSDPGIYTRRKGTTQPLKLKGEVATKQVGGLSRQP